jgi:phospholipase D1/2
MQAKESIYICGWWVSPELYLKRPCNINGIFESSDNKNNNTKEISSRLMDVLLHKAKQGIQINILIYKEVSMAMNIDSSHTKFSFEKLHDNIKVRKKEKNI